MEETRYMISDASKLVGVEAHVLRYWQEQLGITVPRNEMGHRYYTQEHIEIFKNVKQLKDRGFGLRAIKSIQAMPEEAEHSGIVNETEQGEAETAGGLPAEQTPEEKTISLAEQQNEGMLQFRAIMGEIVLKAMEENNRKLGEEIGRQLVKEEIEKHLGETVSDRVTQQIGEMLRKREATEEARYRQLDETIRRVQKNRAEAAAAATQAPKRRLYTVAEDGRLVPDMQEAQRIQKQGPAAKEIRSVSQLKKEQRLLQKKQKEIQRLKKKQEQRLLREQKKNTNKSKHSGQGGKALPEAAAAQAPQQPAPAAEKQKAKPDGKKERAKGLFGWKEHR